MATRKKSVPGKVEFSNLQKMFFPKAGFIKGDMIKYYIDVAPAMLPHLKDRPITMIRFPDGIHGEHFYEKNAPGFAPDWIRTTPVARTDRDEPINYILINDAATLAWCANLAAIEFHPFLHRAPKIDSPTHIAFDLDPGEGTNLLQCIEVAWLVREILAKLGLEAFPKVSGSKGLQLYVPLNTPATYDATKPFANAVARLLEQQHPKLVVSEMAKVLRKNRVFIDWSQNDDKKTTVGVYSLRGKRELPYVSMPVTWDELDKAHRKKSVEALNFSPKDALKRIAKLGDLFSPVLTLKQKLPKQFGLLPPEKTRAPAPLKAYAAKRNFSKTAEPKPELPRRSAQGSQRRFVIQKHAASHLHYDFRLEMDDVLKSWAVPKGLPYELGVRRSAFQTEDHPLDYFDFEGTIPQGEYGGGTVMVWDIGTYEVLGGSWHKGDLKLWLNGKKLKGEWHIFRIKSDEGKPVWLVQKGGEAMPALSPKQDDTSVLSRRSMAQIAKANDAVWQSNRPARGRSPLPSRGSKPPKATPAGRKSKALQGTAAATVARKRLATILPPKPVFAPVMTAREVPQLPEGEEWVYEIKLDGYRGLAVKHGETVKLLSRKNKNLAADFPEVVRALGDVRTDSALIDGEIVALDPNGKPSFQLLQHRKSTTGPLVYYAFDLLSLAGVDLRAHPLAERKAKLARLIEGTDVRLSQSFDGPPAALVEHVRRLGLEGVIAKRKSSPYAAGERNGDWLKFKLSPEQEFVVGGYKPGSPLESLVVGYYEGEKLLCAGKVRQGLNPRLRSELAKLLRPLASGECPFANLPTSKKSHWGEGITAAQMSEHRWVRPEVVIQVSFTEWTTGGNLRHATYKGLRVDKTAREVVRE